MRIAWIALGMMIAGGSWADSRPPTPAPASAKADHEPQGQADSQRARSGDPSRAANQQPPIVVTASPHIYVMPDQQKDDANKESLRLGLGEILTIVFSGGLLIVTFFQLRTYRRQAELMAEQSRIMALAAKDARTSSDTQSNIMGNQHDILYEQKKIMQASLEATEMAANAARESAEVAKRTLMTAERAYVFLKSTSVEPVISAADNDRIHAWTFNPVFANSGSTPTRNAITHTNFAIRDDALPSDFDFRDHWENALVANKYTRLSVGPKAETWGYPSVFHIVDTSAAKEGRKRLFMWGWIDYDDVMEGTPRHRTEFAWEITYKEIGMRAFGGDVPFSFRPLGQFNGSDDECYRKPKPYNEMPT